MLAHSQSIEQEISNGRLLSLVDGFSRFHRIQASPGHREAAHWAANVLQQNGLTAKVLSYPADYGISYLGRKSFQEWECRFAELRLVAPEQRVLADFAATAGSIIQKSGPCDYSATPLDIVLLDQGPAEEAYAGLDIAGKLIFVRGNHAPYLDWALKKRGALGIISDFVVEDPKARTRHDQYDVSRYSSFWHYDTPSYLPFGFNITPREGDRLAKLCQSLKAAQAADPSLNQYPQATCRIEASFAPGQIEVVEATLPGETAEELWAVAHTCHPKTSANDNASGVAAAIEAISALNNLLQQGKLPPLKRTIKIILMPEFSGTMPYLSDHRQANCLAAINMDMVGGKQELGYGPLTLVGLPCSTPYFVADLAGVILNELNLAEYSLIPSRLSEAIIFDLEDYALNKFLAYFG
jgi:hypothetical protein